MITRIDDFFSFLNLTAEQSEVGNQAALEAGKIAQGMTDTNDYRALAAVALHYKPQRIFEIGTYLGVTSNFFLSLIPECEVISIAYTNPRWNIFGTSSNNSELARNRIGSKVTTAMRPRFTQLFGDSHKLHSNSFIKRHGKMDLVFVDGDHSAKGVALDTEFAHQVIPDHGVICWHDANPKPKYLEVRTFLEDELPLQTIGTTANYIGGVAAWSRDIEARLEKAVAR